MESRPDPLSRARRDLRNTWLGGSLLLVACACWAFGALPTVQAAAPSASTVIPAGSVPEYFDGFAEEAFELALWGTNEPEVQAASQPSATSERRAPPLRVRLVGIVRRPTGLRAAVYDETAGRLLFGGLGDELLGHTVSAIDDGSVELSAGGTKRMLRLHSEDHR